LQDSQPIVEARVQQRKRARLSRRIRLELEFEVAGLGGQEFALDLGALDARRRKRDGSAPAAR